MKWFANRLIGKVLSFSVGVMALALIEGHAAGQCELAKLLASDGAAFDNFGNSVSISGTPGYEVAIVGATGDGEDGFSTGSVYIYRRSGVTWVEEQKLPAPGGESLNNFGHSVSISGTSENEIAIVGAAWGHGQGALYIYRFNGVNWVEEAKLIPADSVGDDGLGWSVSISGTPGSEVVIVGAPNDDDDGSSSGAAYIYRFDGVAWIEEAKLRASDGAAFDQFGISVAISGTLGNKVAIVGAWHDTNSFFFSGSAYIYRFNGANWVQEQKLVASDAAERDTFGWSVSISGAPGSDVAIVGRWAGSAYIYRFNGVTWGQETILPPASGGAVGGEFGKSVSISGTPGNEIAIVGARLDDDNGPDSGSAYIYRFNGVNWVEEAKLLASDGAADDNFGNSVSISGDIAFIGGIKDDDNGTSSGSVYVFGAPIMVCPGNIAGGDSGVDVLDLLILLSSWGPCAGICEACPNDIIFNGAVDVTDLLALLAAWGPCP